MRRTSILLVSLLVAVAAPQVASGAGKQPKIEDNIVVKSFDGTPIVATLMLPAEASASHPVPAILETHGWGGSRRRTPSGTAGRLLEEGYAILTWDSRGFGHSGGAANVGSPDFEVKDAGALMTYLASRPEIEKDGPRDPRVGWIGGSNAGGVQLNTAALDHRVDAIVPEIAWGDLVQDLVPNDVPKETWDELLYWAGLAGATAPGVTSPAGPQPGNYAEEIHRGHAELVANGSVSKEIRGWFDHKSTVVRSSKITAPTLIIQGTVDTLFPLEDAFANYLNLVEARTPVKLMAYCSGHTLGCPYPGGASGYPDGAEDKTPIWQDRVVAWLDRYVKGSDVDTGAEVEWQAQDGRYYSAPQYPLPGTDLLKLRPVKVERLFGPGPGGGDTAVAGRPAPDRELGVTAARAEILPAPDKPVPMVGIPRVSLEGELLGVTGHLFFELVDVSPKGERVTVDEQVMPLRVKSGKIDQTVALHGVAWMLQPGHSLEIEITTGSSQYAPPRTGAFSVTMKAIPKLPLAGSLQAFR